jgi:hypothetical protein
MKNIDLFILSDALKSNLESLKKLEGVKLTFTISKNIVILDDAINELVNSVKPSDEFEEYDKKRIFLCDKYTKRDASNNPLINSNNGYDIDETDEQWLIDINLLKKNYTNIIEERDIQISKYNKNLQMKTTVEFNKIELDQLPDNITLENMLVLKYFISE